MSLIPSRIQFAFRVWNSLAGKVDDPVSPYVCPIFHHYPSWCWTTAGVHILAIQYGLHVLTFTLYNFPPAFNLFVGYPSPSSEKYQINNVTILNNEKEIYQHLFFFLVMGYWGPAPLPTLNMRYYMLLVPWNVININLNVNI